MNCLRFHHVILAALLLPLSSFAQGNLLSNTSFEVQGSAAIFAENWEFGNPNDHGGIWGNSTREPWRAYSGSWEGTIRGNWSGADFGGWWQEAPGEAGITYIASAWFWADNSPGNTWSDPAEQVLKIEFYDADTNDLFATVQTQFFDIVNFWTQKSLAATAPANTKWVRWVVACSGTGPQGALQFDDVSLIGVPSNEQDFDDWTSPTFQTDGCHSFANWSVCTGRITSVDARSGLAADIGPETNNYIQSAKIDDGIGTVSFWYRHKDGSAPPVDYVLQTSSDGTIWNKAGQLTGVTNTTYKKYTEFIFEPASKYIRILHTNGANRLLVDDIFVGEPEALSRFQDFEGWPASTSNEGCHAFGAWTLCTGLVTDVDAFSGSSAKLTTSNAVLRSPLLSAGVGEISFQYRHKDGVDPLDYCVQVSTNATNWVTVATISNIVNTTYEEFRLYQYRPEFRFVQIQHKDGTNCLLVDDFDIALPTVYRTQDFDTWPTESSYGTYTYQGWLVRTAIVNSTKAFAGQVARLRDTVSAHSHIQSPYLPEGIGNVTFQYAKWSGAGTDPVYDILLSTDGTNWATNTTITISDTNYNEFSLFVSDTNLHLLRVFHRSGASRALFDEFEITEPAPPADVSIFAWHDPDAPFTGDTVSVFANLTPQNDAQIDTVSTYYRVGTSGAWTVLGMAPTSAPSYVTTSAIPMQATNTLVQYYVRCDFTGPGSEANTPGFYPTGGSNDPALYIVPRNQRGLVWINEINYVNQKLFGVDDVSEFIEIVGPAGFDLTGWSVELYQSTTNPQPAIYATYTLPVATVLSNDVNGFGFYVIGDVGLGSPPVDMWLNQTNNLDDTHIADGDFPSGIRLINEGGGIEQSISYGGAMSGFTPIAAAENHLSHPDPNNIQLTGAATNFDGFAWSTNSMSPGAINSNQTIISCPPNLFLVCTNEVPAPDTNNVAAASDCSNGVVNVTYLGDIDNSGAGCPADKLIITRRYSIIDQCGTSNDCTQTFTISDDVAPVITFCPANIGVETTNEVPAPDTNLVTATENCGGEVTISHVSDVGDGGSGAFGDPLTITRTYRATDVCGNDADCVQLITVEALEEIVIYQIVMDTNVVIYSTDRSGWQTTPYYTTNLMTPGPWMEITNYTIVTNNGTNCMWFDLPVLGTGINTFIQVLIETNGP